MYFLITLSSTYMPCEVKLTGLHGFSRNFDHPFCIGNTEVILWIFAILLSSRLCIHSSNIISFAFDLLSFLRKWLEFHLVLVLSFLWVHLLLLLCHSKFLKHLWWHCQFASSSCHRYFLCFLYWILTYWSVSIIYIFLGSFSYFSPTLNGLISIFFLALFT